jgi:hypothetical protein
MVGPVSSSTGITARFFCNARALSAEERLRYAELARTLKGSISEIRERERGLAFRVETRQMSLPLLAEWVALERRCCPFFEFTIEVGAETSPAWLSLAGEEGVKDFIRQELALG